MVRKKKRRTKEEKQLNKYRKDEGRKEGGTKIKRNQYKNKRKKNEGAKERRKEGEKME